MRVVIVGGSDAGISAGLRARELDPSATVRVLLADSFPNYSICGLPFYISGETPDWRALAHRGREELTAAGIDLLPDLRVVSIDSSARRVRASGSNSADVALEYDRLVLATGAEPVRPPIPGLDHDHVHLLHTMEDSFQVHRRVEELSTGRVLIIGGGYIGLEMADAFRHRDLQVTLVEQLPAVMPTVDGPFGAAVAEELQRHGVEVVTGTGIEAVEEGGAGPVVLGGNEFRREADLVLVSVGVKPAAQLGAAAGLATGQRGAIRVNRRMETTLPGVLAAGDCVETWHRVTQRPAYLPLGTTAHKQGRVAGENAVGGDAEFQGSLGTQVVKVFELAIARTGLRDDEARVAGMDPLTSETVVWDHNPYYPGAHRLRIRVTGDRGSGRLLGAQMLGQVQGQVAKRIDIFATALFQGLSVDAVGDLDLSYTPPFSTPWDPIQTAAQEWVRAAAG